MDRIHPLLPSQDASPRPVENLPEGAAAPQVEVRLPPGADRVRVVVEVPEKARLAVQVEARGPHGRVERKWVVFGAPADGVLPWPARAGAWAWRRAAAGSANLPALLAGLSLGIYLLIRLVALPDFPIYFFTDEAAQTVQAADLWTRRFHGADGELLPVYFLNGAQYNLSASVYLQVLPVLLFGKSIWATRGAAALMTLVAAGAVGVMMDRFFHSRYPWLAVLVLSATPAWFLHSRTAFETSLAASFYAGMLACYMAYRAGSARGLYAAVAFGALSFYSYSPMRVVVLVTGLLLLLSDLPFHRRSRKTVLGSLALALLLALPFARFVLAHPEAGGRQLELLGSYWLADVPLAEKLAGFTAEYLRGLDPFYWYLPNNQDLPRHVMAGYGHLLRQTLPLGLLGFFLALRRTRQWPYRVLLIALLAAPSGAALVRVGITRVLVLVIPAAMLTALAVEWLAQGLQSRVNAKARAGWQLSPAGLSLAMFAVLGLVNAWMLVDALRRGPVWFSDYGLTGMQWGARQVFPEAADLLRSQPGTTVLLSPAWANGTDVLARFFFPDPLPIELASPRGHFEKVLPLPEQAVFVMTPEEFAAIPRAHFSEVRVERTIPYPNGQPGFTFVRLRYADNAPQIIEAEEAARRAPLEARVAVGGGMAKVEYTRLDMGSMIDLFDGSPETLARSAGINPMEITISPDVPMQVSAVTLKIGGALTTVRIKAWAEGGAGPIELRREAPRSAVLRDVTLSLPSSTRVEKLWISVENTGELGSSNVHLWEVSLR